MGEKVAVHVVGTGTIGEPLTGLLINISEQLGLNEVTFHKKRAILHDRGKIRSLIRRGAKLAVDADKMSEFDKMGMPPTYDVRDALKQATVVIDCTPKGMGIKHKEDIYDNLSNTRGFIAQGSEFGFGKMYAHGINDKALVLGEDRFIQVVSCNTHNLAALIESIGLQGGREDNLLEGRFVCLRRATDISQGGDFIPAPQVGEHNDERFGTHHARDAWHLFQTRDLDLNLFSSQIKLNTQYMHSIWFNFRLKHKTTLEKTLKAFEENKYVALSYKTNAGRVFSFGRDHGYFGRILNQTVISVPTLAVHGNEVT